MIFSASITTTAARAEADALRSLLQVTKGLVYKIEVEFPPGCCGLLHCQVFDGSYQLYPTSADDSFHSNGNVIGFDDTYLKQSAPFEFVVKTWNLDEIWEHTIQVRIGLASNEVFMSRYIPSISWDKFNKVLAQAVIDQELQKQAAIDEFSKSFKD